MKEKITIMIECEREETKGIITSLLNSNTGRAVAFNVEDVKQENRMGF